VAIIHQCRLYGGALLSFGLTKADANISSAIDQFGFCEHLLLEHFLSSLIIHLLRLLSDRRQFVHLILFQPSTPDTRWPAVDVAIFSIFPEKGIGGDHPMSAIISSDLANLRKRSTMSASIFANQGWCSFVGSLVTIIILACYKNVMEVNITFRRQHSRKLYLFPLVWQYVVGLSVIPVFANPYHRLMLPESIVDS